MRLSTRYIAGGTPYPLHCFHPFVSLCGSRCGSELLQDMSKGHTFGNGNPPILLIASKWLKLHGTYSVSKYTTSLAENEVRIYSPPPFLAVKKRTAVTKEQATPSLHRQKVIAFATHAQGQHLKESFRARQKHKRRTRFGASLVLLFRRSNRYVYF